MTGVEVQRRALLNHVTSSLPVMAHWRCIFDVITACRPLTIPAQGGYSSRVEDAGSDRRLFLGNGFPETS